MITAIVLAAGQSTRMRKPKMTLPWGKSTVIGQVVSVLLEAGVDQLCVVAGSNLLDLEAALQNLSVSYVINPNYATGEMISSVQVGLCCVSTETEAAMIVLGDQPQIEAQVVISIIEQYRTDANRLIVPSYQYHRGHPWLIDKSLWNEIIDLKPPLTLRDFLNRNQKEIFYLCVDTPSVIQDIDTPEDYQYFHP